MALGSNGAIGLEYLNSLGGGEVMDINDETKLMVEEAKNG